LTRLRRGENLTEADLLALTREGDAVKARVLGQPTSARVRRGMAPGESA